LFISHFDNSFNVYLVLSILIVFQFLFSTLHDIASLILRKDKFFQINYNYSNLLLGIIFGLMFLFLGYLRMKTNNVFSNNYIILGIFFLVISLSKGDRYIVLYKRWIYFKLDRIFIISLSKIEEVEFENGNLQIKKKGSSKIRKIEIPEKSGKRELITNAIKKLHKP